MNEGSGIISEMEPFSLEQQTSDTPKTVTLFFIATKARKTRTQSKHTSIKKHKVTFILLSHKNGNLT